MLFCIEPGGDDVKPERKKIRASQATKVVTLSFAAIILAGAFLLMLPAASVSGVSCGPMTALFTATSATCVTGLVLVDTLTTWTLFGQIVILSMIQLGGLGVMTIIFLLALTIRQKVSINQRLMMVSAFNLDKLSDTATVVKRALKLTLCVEGMGAVILTACFFPRYGWGAVWKGIFTAVSAFCNAGFDLLGPEGGGSLLTYNGHPVVLLTICALVVVSGLGFFVWEDLLQWRRRGKLTLYSRMVLWCTGGLLLFGTLFFFCTEFSNPATMGEMPLWQKGINALFQSVTLRTAGFLSVDQGGLRDVSLVMSCLLMLIGGSSGSTAGGLKTVTVAVLLLSLRSCLRGQETVTLRGRTIPQQKVMSALTLVFMVVILFFAASMSISLLDGVPYLHAAYEAASAIGTVGLTTGITAGLSTPSRLLLIALMYLGRVGILSFSMAFLNESRVRSRIGYPTTDVMIG